MLHFCAKDNNYDQEGTRFQMFYRTLNIFYFPRVSLNNSNTFPQTKHPLRIKHDIFYHFPLVWKIHIHIILLKYETPVY